MMTEKEFEYRIMSLSRQIYTCALNMTKDKDHAADVTQDVMLRLWDLRKELTGIENPKAYALCITRNICLDLIKKHKPIYDDEQVMHNSDSYDPIRQIEIEDTVNVVHRIINTLPSTQREVIALREIHELEYEEIAKITGLGLNNIRVLLSRARTKIKDILVKKYQVSRYD